MHNNIFEGMTYEESHYRSTHMFTYLKKTKTIIVKHLKIR